MGEVGSGFSKSGFARGHVIGHVARDAAWDGSRGITGVEGHHPIIKFFYIAEPYTLREVPTQGDIAETNGVIHPTKRPAQAHIWITPITVSAHYGCVDCTYTSHSWCTLT